MFPITKTQQKNYTNQLLENWSKRKVYSSFRDNIWGAGLDDVPLISKHNKGTRFLLCVIDHIFSKNASIVSWKRRKCITITGAFEKSLEESDRKPNKIWVYTKIVSFTIYQRKHD